MTASDRREYVWELLARIVRAIEAIEDGDPGLAYLILLDLGRDGGRCVV